MRYTTSKTTSKYTSSTGLKFNKSIYTVAGQCMSMCWLTQAVMLFLKDRFLLLHKYIIGQKFDTLLFLNIAYLLLIKPLFTWLKIQKNM